MRWFSAFALILLLATSALAAGSDEQYLDIYNEILQADSLLQGGQNEAAVIRYLKAQSDLQKLKQEHPSWNPDIVQFRQDYLTERIQGLQKFIPATNTLAVIPAAVTNTLPAYSVVPSTAEYQHEVAGMQDQIRSLNAANVELQKKLKEALTIQPAAVSPAEMNKLEARVTELEKERDLLNVALEKERAAKTNAPVQIAPIPAPKTSDKDVVALKSRLKTEEKKSADEISQLKRDAASLEKKLDEANKELKALKAKSSKVAPLPAPAPSPSPAAVPVPDHTEELKNLRATIAQNDAQIAQLKESLVDAEKKLAAASAELVWLKSAPAPEWHPIAGDASVVAERDRLKEELAERSKDLAESEAHNGNELIDLRAALKQSEHTRDELEHKLAAVPQAAMLSTFQQNSDKVHQMEARLAILESAAVPYTKEEMALFKGTQPPPMAEPPRPLPTLVKLHSSKELPAGSGSLWSQAVRASMEHDYTTAEKRFKEVLAQDEDNVYVLAHLANAQFAAGHSADCEKTVLHALALDPDDPGSLYLLGVLRYREDKLDQALDALSRSAQLNPTNAATQNFLGCALADKGLRPAAETALRKSLQSDPEYGEAHFNLAVIYAGNKPPSLELARWHYRRALALGHPKNPSLEKLLQPQQAKID